MRSPGQASPSLGTLARANVPRNAGSVGCTACRQLPASLAHLQLRQPLLVAGKGLLLPRRAHACREGREAARLGKTKLRQATVV